MRIIIDGPPEHAEWALELIQENLGSFQKDWLKVGHGWGYTTTKRPGVSAFLRKLKDGVSAQVRVSGINQPVQAGDAPQVEGEGSRDENQPFVSHNGDIT